MGYNPYKLTALKRKTLSVPMQYLKKLNIFDGQKVLDMGCGNGDDVEALSQFYDISGFDKYNERFNNKEILNAEFSVVTCNYVFNVIADLKEHDELLEQLRSFEADVFIAVRSDLKAVKDTWIYIDEFDCYKTPRGSFSVSMMKK